MIKVIVAEKSHNGQFYYFVQGWPVESRSHQPLLDACRQVKRMGALPSQEIALFRFGRDEWDAKTTVGHGASLTVREDDKGIRFTRYKGFPRDPRTTRRQ